MNESVFILSQLDLLKKITSVVADTGNYEKIKLFKPEDATTNPTLILQAVQNFENSNLVNNVIENCIKNNLKDENLIDEICDHLSVKFGIEILKTIPGYISTEVDASLSFNTKAQIEKALKIIKLYENEGISKDRVLIKLASTWEGIEACRNLEKLGIKCNMTLVFNYYQAIACAQAKATLISPFVGRILDYYVKNVPSKLPYTKFTDPGVVNVIKIYKYFKKYNYKTIIMGASFRTKEQILGLAGCDKLTISLKLLEELENCYEPLEKILDSKIIENDIIEQVEINENLFRWHMNEDAMATEKLSEGIRNFNKDTLQLKELIKNKIQ